ncbi:non-ribosomal peptide synthetase [Pseudomonas extremorientalis]|uniref:Non-ribosomal peptide synthase domain TIGR01720/amino acid adenylation domain-containing protein n=6 Tax=Pseudomonas extremorientalis TaxID=169669 RepID=A0ABY0T4T1_9PSED|nr:non-ribosomal peptide synthetase [Pseudomonas extremorientalis]KAB0511213.1 non-ribosomal peptide synthetase [Pseudomonas extremorientalis]SDP91688.1 non-ribosomal peptide synthase domain TIGR01720/amino acid adenylation domain-containing protein [Pseudomonas extremorientalis]
MLSNPNIDLVSRFLRLPLEQRQQFYQRLQSRGMSFAQLPIASIREDGQHLPLSYAQERQWFLWQLDPDSDAYHVPGALRLSGRLDKAALQRSFDTLVARHASLRTRLHLDGEQRAQEVLEHGVIEIAEHAVDETQLQAWVEAEIARPFDLQHGPLLRVSLLAVSEEEHVLVLVQHHIVSDGWSMGVMVQELMQLYAAYSQGQDCALAPLPIQYADYALWQRSWMEAGEKARQLEYWRELLSGTQPVLELPFDQPRPAQQSFRGARQDIALEPALVAGLKALAQREGVTMFMLLLASFQAFLFRYSGQPDIRVGVPIANRNRVETESLIGFFVNTQVLKADLDGQMSFAQLLQHTKRRALEAQAHQDLPFEQLVEALQPERSLSHNPLFQVMFNHQAHSPAVARQLPGLRVANLDWDSHSAQFDLSLDTQESGDGIWASLTYATDLFSAATVARMAEHWLSLLRAAVANPALPLQDLATLDSREREQILVEWNATARDYPRQRCVHQLIEEQVARTPEATALRFNDITLSYAELNHRANRLAHRLIEAGVGPDVLVGLALERSIEMVVGLLAVLKAGGAYVPLDPEYPRERLAYMLEDSGVKLLLTQAHIREQLPIPQGLETLVLGESAFEAYSDANPGIALDGENLAYVIYTSGSTGQPKGAGNRHSALANRLHWMQEAYGLDVSDTVLQKTPFSFDVSVWEFFWPLMTGARLVVAAPGDHRDPARLINLINQEQVTTLHFVPSMLQAFLQDPTVATCHTLHRIVCSGEALPVDAQQQVFAKLPQAGLYNLYGPTEAAIDVTHWTCVDEGRDAVPIGRPIANLGCYILDSNFEPVPVGVLGELYLGGIGLARGYHRRPALTAERFIAHPFSKGERLYRTGDLARYREDGVIEYAGRIDHQVKLRGLRIELGEIEARLLEHDWVRETAVLAVDGKYLVGYLVLQDAGDDWRDVLSAHLAQQLPDYMIPAQWVLLEQLPLSPNGKLDRKALPKPEATQHYEAPQSALEQQIAAIWAEVLGVEQVGLNDNFFERGGDSIISIQVVSRARAAGIHFTAKALFQHQTVRSLARVAQLQTAQLIDQGPVQGTTPLLPFQQLFFEMDLPDRHHWNQSLLLTPRQPLLAGPLETALQALTQHHDVLRLSFTPQAEGWTARHDAPAATLLWQASVQDVAELQALCERAQRSLDLQQGQLLRAVLAEMADGSQRLLLVMHHLVVDGVSWRVFLEDLQSLYRQQRLPAKTSSFKAWAERLQAHARSEAVEPEKAFWLQQLQGVSTDLPCRDPQGARPGRLAQTVVSQLDAERTRQLLQQAPTAYRTQINDLLLTALARVICQWTGQSSSLIQLEGHGREDLFDDIDLTRTLGWFTSLFPVRLTPADSLATSIKQIKEQLRAVPDKGLGFGALRYLGDDATRQAFSQLPLPRITFNYLGQIDGSFDQPDALFVPAGESAGAEQSPEAPLGNWLTLNGQVYGGELHMGWTFSPLMFDPAQIEVLSQAFTRELTALVEHCCTPGNHGVTASDFPLSRLTQPQLESLPLAADAIEDIYTLSPMQQGMLFHTLYEQAAGDYINQIRVTAEGLDVARFQQAWDATVQAHDVLRSGFFWEGQLEWPCQVVYREARLPIEHLDWRAMPERELELQNLQQAQRRQGFDLANAPLVRLVLVRTDEQRHELIYTNHHILMDGWSNSRLFGEVLQRYAGVAVPPEAGRYRDYIGWLQQRDAVVTETFWREQLSALQAPTRLGSSQPLAADGHGEHQLSLDCAQTERLEAFARHNKVTLNTLIQAAWLILLQRHSGQSVVAFGATVAGRPAELVGVEQQIGLFINTLPVISAVDDQQSVAAWLQAVQDRNLALREHEHTGLYDIQRWAGQGGEALFDNILVFENYPVSKALEQSGGSGIRFGQPDAREQTNFPLTVLVDVGDALSVQFSFARAHFDASTVRTYGRHLVNLLQAMLEGGQQRLGDLAMLDTAERQQVLQDWNATVRDYPLQQGVHQLIEEQVARTPDAAALVFAGQRLSYAELNCRANRLAHRLIEAGVGPDVLVGLAVERSIEMVVGLLAVLKAGGAYVPLDPEYPRDRLAYMLEDSGVKLLLTQAHIREQLPIPQELETLVLGESAFATYSDANPGIALDGENLAYVIYTSGSTGQPKGAGNRHSALANRLHWMQEAYGLDVSDTVLQKTPFSFDVSVWEFFWPLMTGARLVVAAPGDHRDPARLINLINQEQVTTLHFVPSMLQAFLQDPTVATCHTLHRIVCSGEALPVDAQQQVFAKLPQAGLYNLYGPTEAAIDVTHWTCVDEGRDAVPIGRPIANLGCYILDSNFEPVPVGVLGELYLGGIGLARGYHRRPALTAERFVAHPFIKGERLYRTGDLARYREDGVIEYAGRIDHQVKLRGLRIELGEIEARLLEHEWVRETAVLAVDGKYLVGYLVLQDAGDDWRDVLSAHLAQQLPDYMVPAQWVLLEHLPLSPNGKLDRKALPKVDANLQAREYVAPHSELEQQIAATWAEVLDVDRVGLHDNFFELGGHSLLATQVVVRLREQLHAEFDVKSIFTTPTLADFTAYVAAQQTNNSPVQDALAKSLEALKRLSAEDLDKLIS